MHFNYKLRQPAETRSSAHNIPVTERYIYLGQAGEKQGKGENGRDGEIWQYTQNKRFKAKKEEADEYIWQLRSVVIVFFNTTYQFQGKCIKSSTPHTELCKLGYVDSLYCRYCVKCERQQNLILTTNIHVIR